MIATIQIGNSDDKLPQSEWSAYVNELASAIKGDGLQIHFFGSSEGSQPWQNACWVVAIRELEVAPMLAEIKRIRQKYRQDSVAFTLGDVRMI